MAFESFCFAVNAGPAEGNQGAAGLSSWPSSLINSPPPPVTGALGVIGLSGRAGQRIGKRRQGAREIKAGLLPFRLTPFPSREVP